MILVSDLINDVSTDLHDPSNVRWTRSDLLAYLNDGRREILLYRPDANTQLVSTTLAFGSLQTVPSVGGKRCRLLDIKANTNGRSVKLVKSEALDDQRPTWRNDTPSDTVKVWLFDERVPTVFEVWPPAVNPGAALLLVLSVPPDDLTGEGYDIGLEEFYKGPLSSYMKFRAFARDSEDAAMQQLADEFYALMVRQLTGKSSAEGAEKPENAKAVRGDPTV
jgi:hypothetical protein